MAAQVQVKSLFRGFKIPSARTHWACCALKRTATSANVWDNSPFEVRFDTVPQSQISFLKPGYVKTKYQASTTIQIPQTTELGIVRVVPNILVLRTLDV